MLQSVEHLYHWVRSPIWITPGFGQGWAGTNGANFEYTDAQKKYLEENPKKYLEYRKQLENELNMRFKFIIKGSPEAKAARKAAEAQMRSVLKDDKRLCDAIIPTNFNPGCRRPTPAPGYLEALVSDNTTVYTDSVKQITPAGFIDNTGTEHPVDVIICATGFDTTWVPRFPIINATGTDLRDFWAGTDNLTSYLSLGIPGFPNHFTFCGPYGPLGHGSFMPLIEVWTKYMLDVITKLQTENLKSLTPSARAAADFRQHADLFLKRTAWTSSCRSWFKQGRNGGSEEGGQAVLYPGSRLHFLHLLERPRYEDYEFERWDENRFAFLGNGFDAREFDGRDITGYLGSLDEEGRDVQPVYGEELKGVLAGWANGF